MFEKKTPMQTFGPKRDGNEDYRRLHNEELYIIRGIKNRLSWGGHVARIKEARSAFKILTDKHTGNIPLGRPRRRWEDNISLDLEDWVIGVIRLRIGIIGEPL